MLRRLLGVGALLVFIATSFVISAPSVPLGDKLFANQVKVNPKDLELVCSGSFYRSGADTGATVNTFSQIGSAALSGHFESSATSSLKVTDFGGGLVGHNPSGTAVTPLKITASGSNLIQGSKLLNANQIQLVNDSRAAGLLAAPCLRAESDFWMLAADTSVGRESLLILNNPGSVNATVSIETFGTGGKIPAAGQGGISVPAKGSTVVPIASLAPGLQTLALHVRSSSSAITATLQQKTVRGLVAAGADWSVASSVIGKDLVIPGFLVRGVKALSKLRASSSDYGDLSPVLRIFVPGNAKTNATITAQVVGTNAKTFGTVVRLQVAPGTVTDVPLNGLQDGDYSVLITSDQELRAAVRISRAKLDAKPATDFTWIQAATPISRAVGITIPSVGISKLSIVNGNKSVATVNLVVNGVSSAIAVPSGNSVTVSVPNSASVALSSNLPLGANLIVDVNYSIANLPFVDYENVGSLKRVLVR
ncbi:MAG: DUF5719 family protein [Actinomycetes bacterium]